MRPNSKHEGTKDPHVSIAKYNPSLNLTQKSLSLHSTVFWRDKSLHRSKLFYRLRLTLEKKRCISNEMRKNHQQTT